MQNFQYSNWGEYMRNLGKFPGNQRENPLKPEESATGRGIRKGVNYFANAASVAHGNNPTFVTPEFRQKVTALNADTTNAQYDAAKKAQDAQYAQNGMYGQGAHQAADRDLNARRASDMAKNATQTETQLDQTEFQNWNDWAKTRFAMMNQLDQYELAKNQQELDRLNYLANKKMADNQANSFDWGSALGAGLGFLGDLTLGYFGKKG